MKYSMTVIVTYNNLYMTTRKQSLVIWNWASVQKSLVSTWTIFQSDSCGIKNKKVWIWVHFNDNLVKMREKEIMMNPEIELFI